MKLDTTFKLNHPCSYEVNDLLNISGCEEFGIDLASAPDITCLYGIYYQDGKVLNPNYRLIPSFDEHGNIREFSIVEAKDCGNK